MTMNHTYTKLPDHMHIRILTLFPGQSDHDVLAGQLEVANINSLGTYETLSYEWGDPSREYDFVCDGAKVHTTKSLIDALRRIRLRDQPRRVWADQICINQDDAEERGRQVQLMNRIYRNASKVLVWLGNDKGRIAQEAFRLVEDLARKLSDPKAREVFHVQHTEYLHEQTEETWIPLKALTKLTWFERAWIVQEIGTKAPATLFWGPAQIEWATLHKVSVELAPYHRLRKQFDIETSKVKYVYRRFVEPERTSRHGNRFSFVYELHRARHLNVTDPRDRIFAFLGHYSVRHSTNEKLRTMKVDYNKSTEEVYLDVATRALEGDQTSLITLAAVQHLQLQPARLATDQKRLPSWAPDWRTYQSHLLSEPTSPHQASRDTSPALHVNREPQTLSIQGVAVDTIKCCSSPLRPKEFYSDSAGRSSIIETLWVDICGQSEQFDLCDRYVNGDSAIFALTQTLSNGCIAIWWQQGGLHYRAVPTQDWLAHGAAYLAHRCKTSSRISSGLLEYAAKGDHLKWSGAANGASSHRVFARTNQGYYVLGPKIMQAGDVICVLFGGKMPFCLRPCDGKHQLVGECYVHGLMEGEAIDMMRTGELSETQFHVI